MSEFNYNHNQHHYITTTVSCVYVQTHGAFTQQHIHSHVIFFNSINACDDEQKHKHRYTAYVYMYEHEERKKPLNIDDYFKMKVSLNCRYFVVEFIST